MLILLALPQNMTVLSGQEELCSMGESSPRQVKPRMKQIDMETQAAIQKNKRTRDLGKALMLTGDDEFYQLFGIGEKLVKQMRAKGMPHYSSGAYFLYDPRECDSWIKKHWRVQIPEIKV